MRISAMLRRRGAIPAVLCMLLAASPVVAADEAPAAGEEGLVRVDVKNVDVVYRRPGVKWAGYTKVFIAPVSVSFSRSWDPHDYGAFGLRAADVDRMRSDLAALVHGTFAKVLGEGGYQVVEAAGEGVLQVEPDIVNLYVNAPDPLEPGRSRTYVLNTGEMTLALELRDSVTGTLLARARDRRRGTEYPWLTIANRVVNRAEAERALTGWAKQLRRNLDAARAGP
ncbi:MAG: DUF3313 family protein [Steroidobacteraceae bacterium]